MAAMGDLPGTPLAEGDAIVEGNIEVAAYGYLRRVFHVGGRYFAEIEAWAEGAGIFIAPLRSTVDLSTGHVPRAPANRVEAAAS